MREVEQLFGSKLIISKFTLYCEEFITEINEAILTKLPEKAKSKGEKQMKSTVACMLKSWQVNNVLSLINLTSKMDKGNVTYLNPQKTMGRNYEADKRDRILCFKEQIVSFLKLLTEGFNRLTDEQRQVLYHLYFEQLTEVKTASIMKLSKRSIQRIKRQAVINLKENMEIASFMKGAFIVSKEKN